MTDKIADIINAEQARLDREARERHIMTAAELDVLLENKAPLRAGEQEAPLFRRFRDICHIIRALAERDGQISSIGFDLPPQISQVNAMAWLETGLLVALDNEDSLRSCRDLLAMADAVYITNKGRHTRYTFALRQVWPHTRERE